MEMISGRKRLRAPVDGQCSDASAASSLPLRAASAAPLLRTARHCQLSAASLPLDPHAAHTTLSSPIAVHFCPITPLQTHNPLAAMSAPATDSAAAAPTSDAPSTSIVGGQADMAKYGQLDDGMGAAHS